MATVSSTRTLIGRRDAGRRMTLDEFTHADFDPAHHRYELARGIVIVTEVPGPSHAEIVQRVGDRFAVHHFFHPGQIVLRAGGGECRLRLPGMQSDRHPDQAIYLTPRPTGKRIWERWIPAIVVEVVSPRGEDRDYVEKREEYLRAGVLEYWIFDPQRRKLVVLQRAGDVWEEHELNDTADYQTELLPGLVVSVGDILGPAGAEMVEDDNPEGDDLPPAG